MGPDTFTILDFNTNRIYPGLDCRATLTIFRILMIQSPAASFDVFKTSARGNEFCLPDFSQNKDGTWVYAPSKCYAAEKGD